ncbi:MAG: iron-sulfur cluster repair di-iron protein [Bryobacteraceae bacterium]
MNRIHQSVGALAARSTAATRVFEEHGIDFCCAGARSFADVCLEKQLDPEAVLAEIAAIELDTVSSGVTDWSAQPLDALIAHILDRHHTYLRAELPRLETWLAAVRKAHGERDGVMLAALDDVFSALKHELEMHLRKEETILFPAIRRSDGWIDQPVAVMEHEHDDAGRALAELRRITGGFQPPDHACATYRALYAGLAGLEKDLHIHIHLENNILFPRALAEVARGRGC